MKFGRYLKDHSQPEWKRQYINYRILKKAIGKAEEELDEGAQPRTHEPAYADEERDLEGVAGAGPDRKRSLNPALAHLQHEQAGASAFAESSDDDSDAGSGPTHHSRTPFFSRRYSMASMVSGITNHDGPGKRPKRENTDEFLAGDPNPNKWRKGYSPHLTLIELLEILPPACRRFFTVLDRELDRVSAFYQEREDDAVKRFQDLSTQWRELADHKKEYQAYKSRASRSSSLLGPLVSRVPRPFVSGSQVVHSVAWPSNRKEPETAPPCDPRADRPSAFNHGKPEDYTDARSKLKLATYEYYRWLGILKSYKVLNVTGFAKALKKFEKSTRIPCSKIYTATRLKNANFESSTRLDELVRETEDAFTSVFEHGDRKRALERLRELGSTKTHHFAAWRGGLFIGLGLPLLLEGLSKSFQDSKRAEIPYWAGLLQLFGAMLLPILFTLLFFLNLLAWHYARINWVLVFQLDVRTRLDLHQFLDIPAFLFFVFCLMFWAAWSNFFPTFMPPSAYPFTFFIFAVGFMLFPYPIWHADARWWSFRSWCRVFTGGLTRVEFRDFFLGDELNSLYFCVVQMNFMACAYSHGWPADTMKVCSTNATWMSPILASLPAALRLGQSIRRYRDSDGVMIHLYNAGKYTVGICYFFAYYSWRIHGSHGGWMKLLWILLGITNSCYAGSWDLIMDWSLLRKQSRHFLLRPELGFKEHVWIYYFSMVADIFLRFAWTWYLIPWGPSIPLRGYISAVLEVFRRIMWNGFRVESEHIGNVDGYRVTRDVPLPYVMPGASLHRELKDDGEVDTRTNSERFFSFLSQLQASVTKDLLAPLVSLEVLRTPRPRPHRMHSSGSTHHSKHKKAHDSSDGSMDEDSASDDEDDEGEGDDVLRQQQQQAESIQRAGQQSAEAVRSNGSLMD